MVFARTSSEPDAVPLADDHPSVVSVITSVQYVLWACQVLVFFGLVFDDTIAKFVALAESCIRSAGHDYLKPFAPATARFVNRDSTHGFVSERRCSKKEVNWGVTSLDVVGGVGR